MENRRLNRIKVVLVDKQKSNKWLAEQVGKDPATIEVQDQVKKLQNFITEHFYKCSNEILVGLGKMYAGGGEFTDNIDKMGGKGTAEFVFEAIKVYCGK